MKNTYKFIAYAFILMTAVLPVVSHGKALYNSDFCDKILDETVSTQIEMKNFPECKNRWIYLANVQKSYFRNH